MLVKLSPTDYPEIIDLWEASVRASHHFLKPQEIDFYKPLVLKYALPDNQLYGIKNPQLQGFIGIREHKIEMLFVHPDSFGCGLGSQLLDFAVNQLNCEFVDVNEENPRAYEFYRRHGFTLLSRDELDDSGNPHPILHLTNKAP